MMLSAKLVGCLARAPLCYSPQGWRGTTAGQPTLFKPALQLVSSFDVE